MYNTRLYLLSVITWAILASCRGNRSGSQSTVPAGDSPDGLTEIQFGYYFVDGCSQRMKGNLQDAVKLFEECRKMQPENAAVHYELGMLYKLLGNNAAATEHAKYATAKDPRNEWYQLLLVDCYNSAGNYQQAIKIREALVRQFPEKPELKEDLAIAYAVTGEYARSLRIYEELEKTYGVSEQLTLNKVKLLKNQNKLAEAEAELVKLTKAFRNEPRYYGYLAEFYEETNNLEKARVVYDKILEVDPANPTVNLALHDYYAGRGNNILAYEHLTRAFRNAGLEAQVKSGITGTFLKRAEQGDTLAMKQGRELAYLITLTHPEAPDGYVLLGDFSILKGDKQSAAASYWQAASRDTKDVRTRENLLYIENELSRYDSLQKHSAAAMELFPSHARFYLYNGLANIQSGAYAKAATVLSDGASLANGDQQLLLEFYRMQGDAYHNVGDHVKSDNAFEEALKIEPDNAYVLNNYAYYLSLRKEKLDRAEKLSQRTLQLFPTETNFMDTYGWILFQQQKYPQAEQWLEKAANNGGAGATVLEHYGDALLMNGKPADAVKQWQAAKKAGGDAQRLDRKIATKKLDG